MPDTLSKLLQLELLLDIQAFADLGGPVIWAVLAACLLLWLLILERFWFIRISWPRRARLLVSEWEQRQDHQSWRACKIREGLISESNMALHALLPQVRVLIAMCPMLGLLGTVSGMIGVFDVIAASGNDDAQAMARGVYRATIPTMAGLIVALSGIYFAARLRQLADSETARLADRLVLQHSQPSGPVPNRQAIPTRDIGKDLLGAGL